MSEEKQRVKKAFMYKFGGHSSTQSDRPVWSLWASNTTFSSELS